MRIDLNTAENLCLFIGNRKIEGKVVEIDRSGKIFFEINEGTITSAMEIGKHINISFDMDGKKCFIAGKMFFQPPRKILITPETDVEREKRDEARKETPALPATVICKHKLFRHEEIKAVINDLSIKGARIESPKPLKKDVIYTIDTSFPYHHQQLSFAASFQVRHSYVIHNTSCYGITFLEMDIISEGNLKKYLFGERLKHSF